MATYYIGGVAPLTFKVRDSSGALVTPSTITLVITKPDGTTTTPTLTNSSTGVYTVNYDYGTTAGHYTYVLTVTGPGAGQLFGSFDVTSGQLSLSTITFGEIVDQVLTDLHGQTSDLEQLTSLTATLNATDVQFTVTDASQVTRGLVEIDSELMWVKSTDQSNNIVHLETFGRGFRSTEADSHASGAMVTNNPRFPRQSVQLAVQQTLAAVYPDLFQILVDESNTASPVKIAYALPNNADTVVDVSWQATGPTGEWVPVRRWKYDSRADTTAFPSGKSLDIYDSMSPGSTIKVTYIAPLGQFSDETDTLGLVGLSDSARDILVYGACYRLLASAEVGRLQTQSIEQSERSMLVNAGAATSASKYYFGLYSQALQREALRLQKFYPTRSHLVR